MADSPRLHDLDLERALRELGPRYPYPPTPNLATLVRTRLVARPAAPLRPVALWRDPRRLALVAAVLLVVAGAAALINPATRDAIAHFFHVSGVIVTRVPSPRPSLSPATPLDLGRLTTLEEAQRAVKFTIVVPPELGTPDGVYVASGPPGANARLTNRNGGRTSMAFLAVAALVVVAGGAEPITSAEGNHFFPGFCTWDVALAYKPRPGIPVVRETGLGVLVTEFRGDLVPQYITKEVGPGTTLEETSVNGDPGWWIAGQPHTIVIRTGPSDSQPETLRLASDTLVWGHGGVTYRIESGLSKADAMRLAVGLP